MAYFRKPGGRRLMVDQSSRERIRTITIAPVGLEGLLAGCGKSRSVVLPARFVAFCPFVTR